MIVSRRLWNLAALKLPREGRMPAKESRLAMKTHGHPDRAVYFEVLL